MNWGSSGRISSDEGLGPVKRRADERVSPSLFLYGLSYYNGGMIEDLLEELISFRTVTSDREANRRALSWVEERLSGLPLHAARYESSGHPSLVLSTRETKMPKVLLARHMDVVDGGDRLFRPKEEDEDTVPSREERDIGDQDEGLRENLLLFRNNAIQTFPNPGNTPSVLLRKLHERLFFPDMVFPKIQTSPLWLLHALKALATKEAFVSLKVSLFSILS